MKKTFSVILSLLVLTAAFLPSLYALAIVPGETEEIPLLQEGDFDLPTASESHYASLANATQTAVEQAIYEGMLKAESQIYIGSYGIPTDDAGALLAKVVNNNPDLFFVSSSYSYNYYPSTGKVAYLFPFYAMTADEIEAAQAVFHQGVAEALSCVDSSMSDVQKALTLHDYICDLGIYPVLTGTDDNGATVSLDQDIYHSAYGFFYDRQIVCAGFTLAYSYLMNMVGVECTYVGSSTMGHAWNKAKIDGHWYNIDLTFDNFDYDGSGYNTYGSMKHRHFLKSDAYFGTEAGSFHYNGTTYDDCTADNTAFDEAFWDDVQSRIYTVNGDYYYLDPYYNGRYSTVTLTRRSPDGTEEALCDSFSATRLGFYASSTEITDSGRTIHKTLFDEVLAKLSYLDNRFYLCAGNAIYSVTLDGRRFYICPLDANACGLGVNGEHNLFYQLYTGTKTENSHIDVLDKVEYFRQHISTAESDSDYNNYPDINLDGYVNAKDYTYIIQA